MPNVATQTNQVDEISNKNEKSQSNKVGYKGLWGQRSLALVTREICTPICYFCSPIQKWKGIIRIPTFVSKQTCSQNENDKIGETDYSKDKVDQNVESINS